MSINNVNNNVGQKPQLDSQKVTQQQNQTNIQGDAKQAKAATTAPRADSVSLTQSAQQLNQVQKKSSDAPFNQEKVERLKKAIQSGEYRINPDVLAQKIARLESQVFAEKGNS